MYTAVYIGIVMPVEITDRLYDTFRLLCSRSVIEIDQWVPIDLLLQNRKVLANPSGVKA